MENINTEEQEPINMSAMLEEYLAMKKRYPKRPMSEWNRDQTLIGMANKYKDDKRTFNKIFDMVNLFYQKSCEAGENGTYDRFDELYKEEILGDNKRKYDMTSLVHKWMITPEYSYTKNKKPFNFVYDIVLQQNNDETTKEVIKDSLASKELKENEQLIKRVGISEMGKLIYTLASGEKKFLKNYIIRMNENGKTKDYFVFSDISPIMMHDAEYRRMVIEELLSENNITLSNLNGYIGEIKPQINKKEELESNNTKKHINSDKGKESEELYSYTYTNTSDEYELEYDAIAATAMFYLNRINEFYETEKDKKEKDINDEEDK